MTRRNVSSPPPLARLAPLFTVAGLFACSGPAAPSNVEAPGAARSTKTAALETGARVLQEKAPLSALNTYLDGFHFYNGDLRGQMEAHHYCGHLNEDVTQCVMYDGSGADAKLMGVEYVVSRRLFETLPADEKPLWHSHRFEVLSGQLVAPGIPEPVERELMEKLVATYGKTIHTWHTDRHLDLPLGAPMLMMGFTKDGQIDEALVARRDQRLGIDTAERRRARAGMNAPDVLPGADAWESGDVRQIRIEPGPAAPHSPHAP